MVTIDYFDGSRNVRVEVTEEFAKAFAEMERKDALLARRETRRHQSLEKSLEHGFDVPDGSPAPEEIAISKEEIKTLYSALSKLLPSQRELIYRVYFKGDKMTDIAAELGIDASSVRHRMKRAIASLKKFYFGLATFGDFQGYSVKGKNGDGTI